jgi:hypothetical protein
MEPVHTRTSDCGCVETWFPHDGCGETKTYRYHITKCPKHWQAFNDFMGKLSDLRERLDELEK